MADLPTPGRNSSTPPASTPPWSHVAVAVLILLLLAGGAVFLSGGFNPARPRSDSNQSGKLAANGHSSDNADAGFNRANRTTTTPDHGNTPDSGKPDTPPANGANAGDNAAADNTPQPPAEKRLRVVGRIVDRNGDPVIGMPVMLSPEHFITGFDYTPCISVNRSNPTTATGSDGRFELDTGTRNDHYLMLAGHERFTHAVVAAIGMRADGGTVDLGDIVAREAAVLEGVVTDPDGQSVAGARLTWQAQTKSPYPGIGYATVDETALRPFLGPRGNQVTTDEAGRYKVPLPPGQYRLTVEAAGWMTEYRDLHLPEGMREVQSFRLRGAYSLELDIRDGHGQPVPDALVHVTRDGTSGNAGGGRTNRLQAWPPVIGHLLNGARSDADGRARIEKINEVPVVVWVRKSGYVSERLRVTALPETADEPLATDLVLKPATRIVGAVCVKDKPIDYLDSEEYGREWRFAGIEVRRVLPDGSKQPVAEGWIELDSGRFVIDGLPGDSYEIEFRVGMGSATVRVHSGPPPEHDMGNVNLADE